MQLWTYHPSDFPVNDPCLVVDYTKGVYWHPDMQGNNGFRYREVLPKLHARVGTDQFLWCFLKRGGYERVTENVDQDLMEWELNVPLTQILRFYRESVWHDIVHSRSNEWGKLLTEVGQTERTGTDRTDLGALVRVPLKPEWARCHGQLLPRYAV
jgi:hypothetical protein